MPQAGGCTVADEDSQQTLLEDVPPVGDGLVRRIVLRW